MNPSNPTSMTDEPQGPPLINAVTVSLYRDVLTNALLDLADMHNVSKQESRRDVEEIQHRVASEGLPFLTVALPSLGKALDRALSTEEGTLVTAGFELKPGTSIPKFLGVYWVQVFDDTGREKPDADPLAVSAIRQLVYLLYKLEIPYSRALADKVVSEFRVTDMALPADEAELVQHLSEEDNEILETAQALISSMFSGFDPRDIVPRHGPGAVATGEPNHLKHRFRRLYLQIETQYPFTEYFVLSMNQVADQWQGWQLQTNGGLQVLAHGTAKVVLVPKDSRGPRLISCEPLEYQWIQQGLGNKLRDAAERHYLCRGSLNFRDQTVNRRLALESSLGAPWVTLDMKEASDRVSCALVNKLFAWVPELLLCLNACRTPETRLPSGDVHVMKKFAPMGSNLCFPVESILFYVLAVSCIVQKDLVQIVHHRRYRSPCGRSEAVQRAYKRAARKVFVYGDDIVCRREDYQLLLDFFPKVGLLFNDGKCCTHGSFRESCGMDAYKGVPVQPLRLKRVWSARRKQDAVTYASYVAFSNAAYSHGLHRTAEFITQLVEKDLGLLPIIGRTSWNFSQHELELPSALVWVRYGASWSSQPEGVRTRFRLNPKTNKSTQNREIRCLLPTPVYTTVDSDDWCMMLRRLTSPTRLANPGIFPLAHRVNLKWAWIPYADKA